MGDKKNKWVQLFKTSTDSDSWGQPVEALEGYEKLIISLNSELNQLSDDERNLVTKAKVALTLRVKTMKNPGSTEMFSLDMLQPLESVFKALAESRIITFPINLAKYRSGIDEDSAQIQTMGGSKKGGTLLPPPPPSLDGGVQLTIHIEKIGLKAATQYLDPFLTIEVVDVNGDSLEVPQDTPCSNQKNDSYISFDKHVDIQTNINKLPPGAAIIFSFKHWKPRGSYTSTRCWSFMELDEIKSGPSVLEIYQKPTDPKRKKLRLLTEKPLYLHLNLKETVL